MPDPARDEPWLMRTYAGHSSANARRRNLAKGQTGLSVALGPPHPGRWWVGVT